jgi:two-component system, OmpR family, alkaline phosphatase synthesis response regulator PhoP
MSQAPILLVDDEPYIIRSLSYVLEREGYWVETARNGEEALHKIRNLHPCLVFLDVMMPVKNGYQVCAEVREDPEIANTHIIMLSAKGQQVDRERGLLGGTDEYITKPFSPREIIALVRAIVKAEA